MSMQKELSTEDWLKPVSLNSMEEIIKQMKNCVCKIHNGSVNFF